MILSETIGHYLGKEAILHRGMGNPEAVRHEKGRSVRRSSANQAEGWRRAKSKE